VSRLTIGGRGREIIEPLRLRFFSAAVRADKIAREIALRILLQQEVTGMGVFLAGHGDTLQVTVNKDA
jgi:hypothetical protein